jgi:hypothetical protein
MSVPAYLVYVPSDKAKSSRRRPRARASRTRIHRTLPCEFDPARRAEPTYPTVQSAPRTASVFPSSNRAETIRPLSLPRDHQSGIDEPRRSLLAAVNVATLRAGRLALQRPARGRRPFAPLSDGADELAPELTPALSGFRQVSRPDLGFGEHEVEAIPQLSLERPPQ